MSRARFFAALLAPLVLACGSPSASQVLPGVDASPDAPARFVDDSGAVDSRSTVGHDAPSSPPPPHDASAPASGPGFPRLGSLDISTNNGVPYGGYDDGYAAWASKLHVNVMGANWVGAGASLLGGSREALVKAVHSQSTIGSRVFQYYNTDNNGGYWPMSGVSQWLLYENGSSGSCAPNAYDPSYCNTNQTLYTPADSSGLHLEGEYAEALIAMLVTGTSSDAAPSMDGTFHDNTILTPTATGDYQRNGMDEGPSDLTAAAWIRDGLAEGYSYLQLHSKLITIGNLGGWGFAGSDGDGTDASGLSTVVQGGIVEGVFGDSWSLETWSGFAAAKSHYQFCMNYTALPQLVLVHHSNLELDGSDPSSFNSDGTPAAYGTPYQAMRYGLAFTLMDDGYYATTQTEDYFATERNWFDEFAVDPVTAVALGFPNVDAGLGYLGQPTDEAWPSALPSGVYERHFANAATGKKWLVLFNPKGNGAQTVALGVTAKKLTGTQDAATNDGSTVTEVVLQDRDGLILQL